jgi:hypothetical protein
MDKFTGLESAVNHLLDERPSRVRMSDGECERRLNLLAGAEDNRAPEPVMLHRPDGVWVEMGGDLHG